MDGYNFSDYLNQSVKTTSSPTFSGLSVDANTIYVDAINNRLGIKTFYPAYTLDCNGDINTSSVYRIRSFTILSSNAGNLSIGEESGGVDTGNWNTFLGTRAGWNNTASYNTFLGSGTGSYNTTGDGNTFVGNFCGYNNTTGGANTFIGFYAGFNNTTGNYNIFIGGETEGATETISSSIVIGYKARVTANNQLVVGSNTPEVQITDSYWGSGVTKVNPASFTFNTTGGEGTDNPGADLKIAGGKSTGAANGGKIIFQTAPAGPSGATPNTLVDRMTITSDGNVAVGMQTPTAALDVNGITGYNQLRMRTAYTPIGTSDANGNVGDIAWDDDYVYIKTNIGWKRTTLSTW